MPEVTADADPAAGTAGGLGGSSPRGSAIEALAVTADRQALALLTARLNWSKTASCGEALYLWAGRLDLAHLIHGGPVPDRAICFPRSPVVYPPLGAVAVSIGGLAGALPSSSASQRTAILTPGPAMPTRLGTGISPSFWLSSLGTLMSMARSSDTFPFRLVTGH